ncbi:hypothetical protein Ahy_A08g038146 [Arachis hypogaea]|uniref:Peptidase A2 domain-containing protein n=1 Tax=Arachis hypogaea TaxID=3818 RepID=A0A445BSV9_ARAHY|nr:hypothetical protein Ahy_A08g038146 [Arachis hypogaea]
MVSTISIISTEYFGEYEGNPNEDYDVDDEEVFSLILYRDQPGYFQRSSRKQKSHLRPLHAIAVMSGIKVNKVLVDGGMAISLLLERMLMKVGKHHDDLTLTNISITDYSGVSTPSRGLVTIGVKVGSSDRNTIFMVVSSKASYNLVDTLLDPWSWGCTIYCASKYPFMDRRR